MNGSCSGALFGTPKPLRLFDRSSGPGEHRNDRSKRITQTINVAILLFRSMGHG
jgi:hypothetical protein